MKLILFGATGMVGAGALREALADPAVNEVLAISRRACGVRHQKLRELLLPDLFDPTAAGEDIGGWDACIWGAGVSAVGLDEATYAKVTEELTLLWARALLASNPHLSFCYCSAVGTDRSAMWARVRRRVEQAIEGYAFPARRMRAPRLYPAGTRHQEQGEALSSVHRDGKAGIRVTGAAAAFDGDDLREAGPGDVAGG